MDKKLLFRVKLKGKNLCQSPLEQKILYFRGQQLLHVVDKSLLKNTLNQFAYERSKYPANI